MSCGVGCVDDLELIAHNPVNAKFARRRACAELVTN